MRQTQTLLQAASAVIQSHWCVCVFCLNKLEDKDAIVILEKTPIGQDTLPDMLKESTLELKMKNDIYSTYTLTPPPRFNGMFAHDILCIEVEVLQQCTILHIVYTS